MCLPRFVPTLLNFRLLHPQDVQKDRRGLDVAVQQVRAWRRTAHGVARAVGLRGIVTPCGVVVAVSVAVLHVVLVVASRRVVLRLWWLSSCRMTGLQKRKLVRKR
jgi:hypothetical protein